MIGDMIAGVVGKILDRAWPDPVQKAQVAIEISRMQQAGEFKILDEALERARMQTDVNKVEAASTHLFIAGWRPFIGWCCGAAFGWHYIGRPVATWLLLIAGNETPIPEVALGDLYVVMMGMLGIGAMRSVEKVKGVA